MYGQLDKAKNKIHVKEALQRAPEIFKNQQHPSRGSRNASLGIIPAE